MCHIKTLKRDVPITDNTGKPGTVCILRNDGSISKPTNGDIRGVVGVDTNNPIFGIRAPLVADARGNTRQRNLGYLKPGPHSALVRFVENSFDYVKIMTTGPGRIGGYYATDAIVD